MWRDYNESGKIFVLGLSMRGERRSRGRSRSLPNPSPDLITGEFTACFGGEQGKSPLVECDGDVDRQCGFICQVEPPIQPHVNL